MESGGSDGGLPEDQTNRQEEAPGEFTEPNEVWSLTRTFHFYYSKDIQHTDGIRVDNSVFLL